MRSSSVPYCTRPRSGADFAECRVLCRMVRRTEYIVQHSSVLRAVFIPWWWAATHVLAFSTAAGGCPVPLFLPRRQATSTASALHALILRHSICMVWYGMVCVQYAGMENTVQYCMHLTSAPAIRGLSLSPPRCISLAHAMALMG